MISKKNRFLLRKEPNFFKKAQKKFFTYGVVFYQKEFQTANNAEKSIKITKIAGIVPKKKWKKASERNHQKRILRSVLATICQDQNLSKISKIVVYLNRKCDSYQDLTRSINKAILE
jgi:ribonuclease P protein component